MRPKLRHVADSSFICKPSKKAILRNFWPTYAVGFVRAYAEYLGLDGAQVADRFKEEGKVKASRTPLSPSPSRRAVYRVAPFCWLLSYCWWWLMAVGSLCPLRTTRLPVWCRPYRNAWRRWSAMKAETPALGSLSAKNRRPQRNHSDTRGGKGGGTAPEVNR